jgi:hypothetical protein
MGDCSEAAMDVNLEGWGRRVETSHTPYHTTPGEGRYIFQEAKGFSTYPYRIFLSLCRPHFAFLSKQRFIEI